MKKQHHRKALLALLSVLFLTGVFHSFYVPLSAADAALYDTLMASESLEAMDSKVTSAAVQGFTKEQALNLITRASALYYSLSDPTPKQGQTHLDLLQKYYNHPELVAERKAETDDESYQSLTQTKGALSKGKYRLNDNLKLTGSLTIAKNEDVTIDLNGYAIIATTKNCIISLENSTEHARLTIIDTNPTGNVHYFESSKTAEWELLTDITDKTGYFMIPGGILTGGHNPSTNSGAGGAIHTGAGSKNAYKGVTTFNGGTIVGNYSARGGGAAYGGKFVMEKGVIVGNYANQFAGAIAVSGVLDVKNGLIIDNNMNPKSTHSYTKDENKKFLDVIITTGEGSEFNFSGGEIFGNVRTVVSSSSPEFSKTGGTLYGDYYLMNGTKAVFSGGAVYGRVFMEMGSCTVTGDAIISNRLSTKSSAIHIAGAAKFAMNGGIICDSWADQNGGAIYLASDENTECIISGGLIENCTASDGGAIYIKSGTMKVSGGEIRNNKAENGGAIYMGGGSLTMSGTAQIHNCSAVENGGAIYMGGGSLTMTGGEITENNAQNGGAAYLAGTGEMEISGGTLSLNAATANGGAAYLAGGTLQISGTAEIEQNTAQNGGAAYLASGTVTVSGGTLSNNEATVNGGAAYLGGGTLEIGGTAAIEQNTAQNGGAAYIQGGSVTMSGGTMTGCTAETNGGAICVNGGSFSISDGTVTGCTAAENGGAVYVSGGDATMSGGTMTECTATQNGGAVCVEGGSFTVSGEGTIYKTTGKLGGAVYVSGGNAYVHGGELNECSAESGGAIYVQGGTVTMLGGEIINNKATNGNGGAILVTGSSNLNVTVKSGTIQGNSASANGGAISVEGQGNNTVTVQIGVNLLHYNADGTSVTCDHNDGLDGNGDCPVVKDNVCISEGGAIYISGSDTTNLNIYCIEELGNRGAGNAAGSKETSLSDFLKVDGGKVLISAENHAGAVYYGDSVINSSIHVTGGDLELQGTIANPAILAPITVDVLSDKGDAIGSYTDERENDKNTDKKYYVVKYFENFIEEGSTKTTGQYTVHQALRSEDHTIWGVIYSHTGLTIVGWNTKEDGSGQSFDVSSVISYAEFEQYLIKGITLELYAIWAENFYWIKFDPVVDSYSGSMGEGDEHKQSFLCAATSTPLPANGFVNLGYKFMGWSVTEGSDDVMYTNGQNIPALSQTVGDVITLYAVWELCDHTEYSKIAYNQDSDTTVTCTCQCSYYLTVTITAPADAVFNNSPHAPTLETAGNSGGKFNLSHIPGCTVANIVYKYEPFEVGYVNNNNVNTDAGTYTAELTVGDKTVTVEYMIAKATQPAPTKPVFTINESTSTLTVTAPVGTTGSFDNVVQYSLYYRDENGNPNEPTWQTGTTFNNYDKSWTLYYIAAYYPGNNNYEASEEVVSDQKYLFQGKIIITVVDPEGMKTELNKVDDAAEFISHALEGYYISSKYELVVSGELKDANGNVMLDANALTNRFTPKPGQDFTYQVSSFSNEYQGEIILTFKGAEHSPTVDMSVAPDEQFGTVTDVATTIGKDSAFTAYFDVNYFDTSVYSALTLTFDTALPVNTTIIMVDKVDGSYWYYKVTGNEAEILISKFKPMGSSETMSPAIRETGKYQFIVDFSDADMTAESLGVRLTATVTEAEKNYAPVLQKTGKQITLVAVTHTLGTPNVSGTSANVSVGYAQGAENASKWEEREATLVLIPNEQAKANLPIDATVTVIETVGDTTSTTTTSPDNNGNFVITLDRKATALKIVLQSQMFADASYPFELELYAAYDGEAPMNGERLATAVMTLTSKQKAQNSADVTVNIVKVTKDEASGQEKVDILKENVSACDLTDTINVILQKKVGTDYTATVTLLKKNSDGEYISTGWSQDLTTQANRDDEEHSFFISSLDAFGEGSFCLSLVVRDASNTAVLTVPYYFMIQKTSE